MHYLTIFLVFILSLMVNGQFGDYPDSQISRSRSRYMQTVIDGQKKKVPRRRLKKCNLDNLISCIEPSFLYSHKVNGSGLVHTDEEYEDVCL